MVVRGLTWHMSYSASTRYASRVLQRASDPTGSRNVTDHRIFNEIKYSMPFPVRFSLGPFRSIFYAFRSYSEKLISCWAQMMFSWTLFGLLNDK